MGIHALNDDEYRDFKRIQKALKPNNNPEFGISPVITSAPIRYFLVKITSSIASQGGRYNGKVITSNVTGVNNAASTDLAAEDLGGVAPSENCIVWNLAEIGSAGHNINLTNPNQIYVMGYQLGLNASNGKVIIGINGPATFNSIVIRIISSTLITANRWKYTVIRQITSTLGSYQDDPNASNEFAWNTMEQNNSSSGLQGNGANLSNYPAGAVLRPNLPNAITDAWTDVDCTSVGELFFAKSNGMPEICTG